MLRHMLYLARGQVRVRVTGASLARFLNLCAQNGLVPRHMRRTGWNELYATLSLEDFRALRRYMGRTGCRVHIVRRMGAPFCAAKLWPRRILWGGALGLFALCYILTTRVWAIEKKIDPALPEAELMSNLRDLGVCIGARSSSLDVRQLRWQIQRQMPEIAFIALNLQGNRLTIEARKAVPLPDMLDENAVAKVVATRTGVISSMRVQEGSPQVKAGDAVFIGDTLISGLVPPTTEGGDYRLAHARGLVYARTAYEKTVKRPLTFQRKTYTGRTRRQIALIFGKKRVNLYAGSGIPGGSCDKIVETKTFWLSESVVFPVSLVVQTYRYYTCAEETATLEAVQSDMGERALDALRVDIDGEITAYNQTVIEDNGAARLSLSADALEQIGEEALDDSVIPETPPETSESQE